MTCVQVSDGGLVDETSVDRINWNVRVERAKKLGKGLVIDSDELLGVSCLDDIEMILVDKVEEVYGRE